MSDRHYRVSGTDRELSVRSEGESFVVVAASGREYRIVFAPGSRPGLELARVGESAPPGGGAPGKPMWIGQTRGAGGTRLIAMGGRTHEITLVDSRRERYASFAKERAGSSGREVVKAPIPGLVTELKVSVDQRVAKGETLVVLYAMKLENEIRAPFAAHVRKVMVRAQQSVEKGTPIVELEASL